MTLSKQDLYAQAGEMLRHYLLWREKILGGYAVVVAALALAVVADIDIPRFDSGISVLGALLTITFWLLDLRNRQLFEICLDAGAALENAEPTGGGVSERTQRGVFTALNNPPSGVPRPSHSTLLNIVFGVATVILLLLAGYFWYSESAIVNGG